MAVETTRRIVMLDPTVDAAPAPFTPAPRLKSLKGKVIGLLDNSKMNSDEMLKEIGDILNDKYGFKEVIVRRKHSASLPPKPEIADEFVQKVDAVIAGIGD